MGRDECKRRPGAVWLRDLNIELWPYEPLADRVWELRANLTSYDASSYDASSVALAELLAAPVGTVDKRIAATKRLRCAVISPPGV